MTSRYRLNAWRVHLSSAGAVVLAIFLLGIALRVAFMVIYRPGFLGIADTGSYLNAARGPLFGNVYDPAGYPLFVRALHVLYPHLSFLILVQHGLGVATAALWYLAVRRVTGSALLGLIPAVLVLFDGYALWVEHTPITETLFTFLVAASLYLVLRGGEGRWWLIAAAGGGVAVAAIVRPVGFVLAVVAAVWLLLTFPSRMRFRLLAVAALLAPVVALSIAYVLVQRSQTGFTGVTQDSGRVIYARAAQFADCSKFTPPRGTRGLCQTIPQDRRGSFNQYLTGAPDRATVITLASRSVSPAWRVYGPPPAGNSQLRDFGLTAMVNQPLDYLSLVADDFHYYWADHHRAFIAAAARPNPGIEQVVSGYYHTGPGVASEGLGFLRWYGETIEVTGPLMIILLIAPVAGLFAEERRARQAAALFAATGWLLPLVADAVASVDPRFMLPAYGPLAAAGAIGLAPGRLRSAIVWVHRLVKTRVDSATSKPSRGLAQ